MNRQHNMRPRDRLIRTVTQSLSHQPDHNDNAYHGTLRLGAQQRFGVKTMISCGRQRKGNVWRATLATLPIFNHLDSAFNHLNFLGPATQCFGSKL